MLGANIKHLCNFKCLKLLIEINDFDLWSLQENFSSWCQSKPPLHLTDSGCTDQQLWGTMVVSSKCKYSIWYITFFSFSSIEGISSSGIGTLAGKMQFRGEIVIKFNGLPWDGRHRSPYNSYKLWCSLGDWSFLRKMVHYFKNNSIYTVLRPSLANWLYDF